MDNEYGFEMIAILVLVGIAVLLIVLFVLRYYVFCRLLQKERTVRATVRGKRCDTSGTPAGEGIDTRDMNNWSGGDMYIGCLGIVISLLAAIPWKKLAKNGLDEPYLVKFDMGGNRHVNLSVSYEVYLALNQGQEGLLTYKGNCLQRFRSLPSDKGGPMDLLEKNQD